MRVARACLLLIGVIHALPGVAAETAGDDLGRLFFSRDERAALDAARAAATLPLPHLAEDDVRQLPEAALDATAPPPLPAVTLNGIVTRSRGPATVWVNGTAQDARHVAVPGVAAPRVRVARDALELSLDQNRPARRVKAGQTFDPAHAVVHEAHEAVPAESPHDAGAR